jgi:hypothetical protein
MIANFIGNLKTKNFIIIKHIKYSIIKSRLIIFIDMHECKIIKIIYFY